MTENVKPTSLFKMSRFEKVWGNQVTVELKMIYAAFRKARANDFCDATRITGCRVAQLVS